MESPSIQRESTLKKWILASRPQTLGASLAPVLMGTALAIGDHKFHLLSALSALFGAMLIQIGTNLANDYFDFMKGADREDRLGPLRMTQAGMVSPSTMKKAFILMFALALIPGIYLVFRGGLPIVGIGIFSILFGILYTGGPYPLGYNGLGDVFVLIFFGPVALGGTYYVQGQTISGLVLLIGLIPGFLSMALLAVNNLRDVDTDAPVGKKTLAVRFGKKFARWEYVFSVFFACFLPLMVYFLDSSHPKSLICLLLFFVFLNPIKKVFTIEGRPLNQVLAYTGKMLLLYSLVFSVSWLL